MKSLSLKFVLALFSFSILAGCKDPSVKSFSISPRYFCSGDSINFQWETENLENVRIVKADGTTLFTATGDKANQNFSITKDMVPLDVKAEVDGGTHSLREYNPTAASSLLDLFNVDAEHWTESYTSDCMCEGQFQVKLGTEQKVKISTEPADCVDRNGVIVHTTKEVWDVSNTIVGYTWIIPTDYFGPKAKLIGVENCSDQPIELVTPEKVTISAHSQAVIAKRSPGGSYEVKLITPSAAFRVRQEVKYGSDACSSMMIANQIQCDPAGKVNCYYDAGSRRWQVQRGNYVCFPDTIWKACIKLKIICDP